VTEKKYPTSALKQGKWFKLICGASFQHLPAIRSLALAYTLAGADCIDVAADEAVIKAALEGIETALSLSLKDKNLARGLKPHAPLLMVSVNDGEDPHFRKAEFNPQDCPADCPRPCEKICPANAIAFRDRGGTADGVFDDRCYGCGRCLPVCPKGLIVTRSYISTPEVSAQLIQTMGIRAIEIHTQVGHAKDFQRIWRAIAPITHQLDVLAISCPDDSGLIEYLNYLYQLIGPLSCDLIWQTDGRPMSGDIGIGTTAAAVKLGQKVLEAKLPGYVQLAGGTNQHTVTKLKTLGLLKGGIQTEENLTVSGIAYGSYARSLLNEILEQLETRNCQKLENFPNLLWEAVTQAKSLVRQLNN
jgi:Fe-S-cluster-containing hydrogenase component 2